jgi:hypothetical protein
MTKKPRGTRGPKTPTVAAPRKALATHPSQRIPLTAAPGVSTRDFVYQCLTAAAPDGAQFDDDTQLSSIPVNGDDVGVCLNYRIPLTGNNAWGAGDIQGTWTVDILTSKTDYRRNH